MQEVRNLDDLDKNGIFFLKLRSTGFASLLTFDNDGLEKLQKIYCHNNRLTSLLLNESLQILFCPYNKLTSLHLKN